MNSIRRTLLWRLGGGALVLMVVGAALLNTGVGWLLTAQFDTTLQAKLATFITLIDEEGYDIEITFDAKSLPEYVAGEEPEYVQLWLDDGQVLYRSPTLGSADLPMAFGDEATPLVQDVALPDGRKGRAIGAAFTIRNYEPGAEDPGPAHVILVMARGRGPLDRALALLMAGSSAGILLLLAAGALIGRAAVRRGLLPLEDLARHVSDVTNPLRTSRFAVEGLPEELVPLAESHNQMLQRIGQAFERERRTTANIAHELRTPVSELVLLTDVAARSDDDLASVARRLDELREIGGQMSTLISTLLELARMESGQVPLEVESIDLAEMVRACWGALSTASEATGVTFSSPEGSGPMVRTDRAALSILLTNLLANAVQHAPPGDQVVCKLGQQGQRSFCAFSNAANGLKPEDLDKLTEPFWRRSAAREERAHAGLGLSLVARLAALLDLELAFRLEAGVFQVELGFSNRGTSGHFPGFSSTGGPGPDAPSWQEG